MKRILLLAFVLGFSSIVYGKSTIETCSIQSKILNAEKKYCVYLPDGYEENPLQKYPVLYLLHGSGGCYTTWEEKHHLKLIADTRISSGFALPMIIVMPDASGEGKDHKGKNEGYFNYEGWRYQDFFIQEFIPEVEKRFRVKSERKSRAISGMSMGGGGTTIFAMFYPEMFGSACPIAGRVEGMPSPEKIKPNLDKEYIANIGKHDMVKYLRNASKEKQKAIGDVRWLIDVGDSDYMFVGNTHLYMQMLELGFQKAQFRSREGAHNSEYWRTSLPEILTFISIGYAE